MNTLSSFFLMPASRMSWTQAGGMLSMDIPPPSVLDTCVSCTTPVGPDIASSSPLPLLFCFLFIIYLFIYLFIYLLLEEK